MGYVPKAGFVRRRCGSERIVQSFLCLIPSCQQRLRSRARISCRISFVSAHLSSLATSRESQSGAKAESVFSSCLLRVEARRGAGLRNFDLRQQPRPLKERAPSNEERACRSICFCPSKSVADRFAKNTTSIKEFPYQGNRLFSGEAVCGFSKQHQFLLWNGFPEEALRR
jgi:hypothetical protein